MHTPKFPRIDFDDWISDELADRKPAWKQLQENVKSSYNKANSPSYIIIRFNPKYLAEGDSRAA
jgi:hypothetical protein